jgi:arginine N-succinyltransferase
MEFERADDLTSLGKKSFIAELMPRHPLYIAYLPQEAQDAVGLVHVATAPARRLLEQEGMYYEGYVDIFDAGPVLQARVRELRALRDSALVTVAESDAAVPGKLPQLVANTSMHEFRVVAATAEAVDGRLALATGDQDLLHCHAGETIRTLSMNPTH